MESHRTYQVGRDGFRGRRSKKQFVLDKMYRKLRRGEGRTKRGQEMEKNGGWRRMFQVRSLSARTLLSS